MDGFTTSIKVTPSFDHRFDPEQWRKGCGSMQIEFVLGGPLGFVTASVNTGWMSEPLTARPTGYGGAPSRPWGNEVRAIGKVGFDVISSSHDKPMAGGISCHAAAPPVGKEWFSSASGCTLIEGGTCYGDTGCLVGDEFLLRLSRGGDEAAFGYLREIHDDWLAPETAVS